MPPDWYTLHLRGLGALDAATDVAGDVLDATCPGELGALPSVRALAIVGLNLYRCRSSV